MARQYAALYGRGRFGFSRFNNLGDSFFATPSAPNIEQSAPAPEAQQEITGRAT